jgi:hypothetical protein
MEKPKYFTYTSERVAVYGRENCFGYGPLFVTEGIWDSISIGNIWFDSVAVLCNTPCKEIITQLRYFAGDRKIVAVCDNDEAGKKLARVGDIAITLPEGIKDPNSAPEEILRKTLLSLCDSPL